MMRYLAAAATAVTLFAVPAQAAPVELTYEATLQVTDTYFHNTWADDPDNTWSSVEYSGPEVGQVVGDSHHLTVYLDVEGMGGCRALGECSGYYDLDSTTGAVGYGSSSREASLFFKLFADGTGTWERKTSHDFDGHVYSIINYDVLDWSVDGLPEVAPVPLPASLPLLAVGVGAFAAMRRKQRRASA